MAKAEIHNHIGSIVQIETTIDSYIGYLERFDVEYKIVWISQCKSLIEPLMFNMSEIKEFSYIKKVKGD